MRSYLDWNATAPVSAGVRAAMAEALEEFGNPSSVHAEGRRARALIDRAREQVAALAGVEPEEVFFTSGGTEANHLALSPGLAGHHDAVLFMASIEHPSVLSGGRFEPSRVVHLPVTRDGVLDLTRLAEALRRHQIEGGGAFMLALMAANNETGAVQPVAQAAELAHEFGGVVHCDAVQAAGKLPLDAGALGADSVALAAHKIGGSKGIGALVVRKGRARPMDPVFRGGGQELGWRAGTENVAGIVGFGVAAEESRAGLQDRKRIERLRDRIEHDVKSVAPGVVFFAAEAERLPNTSCFAVEGLRAETVVMSLDLDGVAVSSGAACSSGKVKTSHVMAAMGTDSALAECAIRVSIGRGTGADEAEHFLGAWRALYERFEKRHAAA